MPLEKVKTYTTEDIYSLPEGRRAELIDGQIYYMAPPNRMHQKISGGLYAAIYSYIKQKNGACEVYSAPFAVFLKEDDKNYVEPDISVICDTSKLTEKGCAGAPDWVIEIVSPASIRMDYITKAYHYLNAGVREYWIVDPKKGSIILHNFEHDTMEQYSFQDKVKVGIYEDLYIDFSDITE